MARGLLGYGACCLKSKFLLSRSARRLQAEGVATGFGRAFMKKLLVVVAVLLVIAAPVRASAITLDFSGTVDLSGVGGAAS